MIAVLSTLATDRATLGVYFSLAVLGSIGDKFGFTNLRSYRSKSEFYDVFKEKSFPRLDFKRIFICLCLRSFDARKTRKRCFVFITLHFTPGRPKITKVSMVDLSSKTIKFKRIMEFQIFKIIQDFKKVYMRRFILFYFFFD